MQWSGETSAAAHWPALLAREFNAERGRRWVQVGSWLLRARFPTGGRNGYEAGYRADSVI